MRSGTYPLTFKVWDEDDNEIKITQVRYYGGFKQTLEEPGEPACVEIVAAEDKDGVEIEELDELNEEYFDEVEQHWKDYYGEGRV